MKAATTKGFGPNSKLVVTDTNKPEPGPSDVVVEVFASSVNPKDWKLNKNISSFFPAVKFFTNGPIIGDDMAGIVVSKGSKVNGFNIGDEIYGMDMNLRTAACAEFALIDHRRIAHKPVNLGFEDAASAPLAALTALQAFQMGQVQEGSKVLIIGASGGVGTFAVQIAKAMGAKVTGVCSGRNIELVEKLGADATIDYTKTSFTDGEDNFDMVFDATSYESLASCSSLLTEKGIFVSTGGHGKALLKSTRDRILSSKQSSKNVWVNANTADLEILKDYFENEKLKPVIDSEFSLDDIDEAYKRSKTGRSVGKIVVKIK